MNVAMLYHVDGSACLDGFACAAAWHTSIPPACGAAPRAGECPTAGIPARCELPAGHPGPHLPAAGAEQGRGAGGPAFRHRAVTNPEQARANRAYVRRLLRQAQPDFAIMLESVIHQWHCPSCQAAAGTSLAVSVAEGCPCRTRPQ